MARAAAAAAAGTVQFGCPRAERGRGVGQTWQDIDLNPQIVCSNKLFQVRCHFPFALPPLPPLFHHFTIFFLLLLLPLAALGSSLATPCTCPAPFRNGRHVRAQLLFILTICCAQERCTTVPPSTLLPPPSTTQLLLPLLRHFLIAQRSKFSAYCFSPPGHVLVHVADFDFDFGCVSPGSLAGAGVAVFIMAARVRRRHGHRQRRRCCRLRRRLIRRR